MVAGTSSSPLSLRELATLIQLSLEQSFGQDAFWVVAEVMKVKYYAASRKYYFELAEKDPHSHQLVAKLDAHTWQAGTAAIQRFIANTGAPFSEGQKCLMRVQVEFHPQYGLKVTLIDIDASFTLGQIALRRQELINRLLAEHPRHVREEDGELVTTNKETSLPLVAKRIVVIGSPQSDGYRDFVQELNGNRYGFQFELTVLSTLVQGNSAGPQMEAALKDLLASGQSADAIVFLRGGGAASDLSPYEHYPLVALAAACPLPILTGIGHDRDETLLDLVVFQRCKTPTKAAAALIEHNLLAWLATQNAFSQITQLAARQVADQQNQLATYRHLLTRAGQRHLSSLQAHLNSTRFALTRHAQQTLAQNRQQMQQLSGQVQLGARQTLTHHQQQLAQVQWSLQLNDPAFLAQRGFFRLQQGRPLSQLAQADLSVPATLSDGTSSVTITFTSPLKPL